MRRLWFALLAVMVFGLGAWTPVPATAKDFTACNGVWVVVDFGSLGGGVSTRCATSFSSGSTALQSTFGARSGGGMITAIAGKPGKPDVYKNYWSYWHATRRSDGSYSGWSYSNLGASSYHPTKGAAEGWHYVSTSGSASAPGAKPPNNPVAAPKPKPKPTTTKPTTAKTSTPATATTKPIAAKSPAASPTPSPTSPTPTPTPTPSASPAPADDGTDPGSPTALIITAATVGLGGLGAGAWWLTRGRKR